MDKMKEAIRNLHQVYYSIDPFESRESFLKFHHALEHCFDLADITSTISPDLTSEQQFETLDPDNPPESLKKAWDKATRGEF